MPITTRKPAPATLMQRFRTLTEGYLLQVAQKEMMKQYPGTAVTPAPKKGLIYRLLPIFFLPGFKLTPWPIKRRLLSLFFVHERQKWPSRPWEKD